MASATTRNTRGKDTHVGRPVGLTSVKKIRSLEDPSIRAGKRVMNPMRTSTATGA